MSIYESQAVLQDRLTAMYMLYKLKLNLFRLNLGRGCCFVLIFQTPWATEGYFVLFFFFFVSESDSAIIPW